MLGSIYLSMDEVFKFHESDGVIQQFLRRTLHLQIGATTTIPLLEWLKIGDFILLTYALPVIAACVCFRREFASSKASAVFFCCGALLLLGSEFVDMGKHAPAIRSWYEPWRWHSLAMTIEESLKLLGFSFIFGGILNRLSELGARIVVTDPLKTRPQRVELAGSGHSQSH
jgi:hypothetical protein